MTGADRREDLEPRLGRSWQPGGSFIHNGWSPGGDAAAAET